MKSISGYDEKNQVVKKKLDLQLKVLPSVFSDYCKFLGEHNKTDATKSSYITTLAACFRTILGEYYFSDEYFYSALTEGNFKDYFNNSDFGIKTLQGHWSVLNSFLGYLQESGHIEKNPLLSIPRPCNNNTLRQMNYLSRRDLDKLLSVIKRNPTKFTAFRDEVIIKLAIVSGLSVGDLLNLNFDDIDYANGTISVVNKQGERTITIGMSMMDLLKKWSDFRNVYFEGSDTFALFVSTRKQRMSEDRVNEMLSKYCEQAEIARRSFKDLKSTMIYLLAKEDVSMEDIMNRIGVSDYLNVVQAYDAAMKEKNINIDHAIDRLFGEAPVKRQEQHENRYQQTANSQLMISEYF